MILVTGTLQDGQFGFHTHACGSCGIIIMTAFNYYFLFLNSPILLNNLVYFLVKLIQLFFFLVNYTSHFPRFLPMIFKCSG